MRLPGFVGPSNVLSSVNADVERTIGFYIEPTAPGQGLVERYLTYTPGLRPFIALPTSPLRAMFFQDTRAFVVAGNTYYEIFPLTATFVAYGTVAVNEYPAQIVSNGTAGNQNLIVSGDLGYVHDLLTNSFAQITDPGFPARVRQCEFLDGYGVVLVTESRQFQISALEDFTSWDPLDVAEVSNASDNLTTMLRSGATTIMFHGSRTSQPWYNSGDALFPFAPVQSSWMEHGSVAPFAACRFGDTEIWLGQDVNGQGMVWALDGMTPRRVSTTAIERAIQAGGNAPDHDLRLSQAWTYQEQGHEFYCLLVPNDDATKENTTLVYDRITSAWHERATWDPTNYQWLLGRPTMHIYAYGKHLVGDRLTGMIYEMSLDYFDEELVTP